ncbi:MAG: uroporphyrinogen-III synthase [Pseudomonadota bacterium]|nr:uroporphyrinogen-III synthase [Pseudomonadota bacterium]
MRRLFILRPEPGASETLEKARSLGIDAVAAPLFKIEPVEWDAPEASSFDALLVTSANTIRNAGEKLKNYRGLAVHAVGAATADAARQAGFNIASSGDSGVDRLLRSIDPDAILLHLGGEDRRKPADARQSITFVTLYRTVPLGPDLSGIAGAVAMIHSPGAAQRLGELISGQRRASVRIAAISKAAAEAAGEGWKCVEHAKEPSDSALLALAARLCEKQD